MMCSESHHSLKSLSYFGCGGPVHVLHAPSELGDLQQAVCEIRSSGMSHFILGGGSNSLISDRPYEGHVISTSSLNHITFEPPHTLRCGAGVTPDEVAHYALACGLKGASWMSGLPGHIGGAVRMNARCYGSEIAQVICGVTTVNDEGIVTFYDDPHLSSRLFYGYKDTYFMTASEVIYDVCLQLSVADDYELDREKDLLQFCKQDRRSKGQYLYPSCGCVFKNDYTVGVPSGMLLELAGAKGQKVGGAKVSSYHSNFIHNHGASSVDILELSFMMRSLVYNIFGVWLEYEMECLGDFSAEHLEQLNRRCPIKSEPLFEKRRSEAQQLFDQKSTDNAHHQK